MNNNNNVIAITNRNDYDTMLAGIVSELYSKLNNGESIDAHEVINNLVDPAQNNSRLVKFLETNDVMSPAEFRKAIANKKQRDIVIAELGYYPVTAPDFVEKYTQTENISILLTSEVSRKWRVFDNATELTAEAVKGDRMLEDAYRMHAHKAYSLADMEIELKLLKERLKLPFTSEYIRDSITDWSTKQFDKRKQEIYADIAYTPGRATGPDGKAEWAKMERACFDVPCEGYSIGMIAKTMYQVKRKLLNLPIDNHLFVVITGGQGGGKTTFLRAMVAHIADAAINTNLMNVTDEKVTSIWKMPLLILDEMYGANKADMTALKEVITATHVPRRIMYSGRTEPFANQTTMIGTSNHKLDQIISDTTGIRRFGELCYKAKPDWDLVNSINWPLLWQSVDPHGPDPMEKFSDVLKENQEESRNKCPVEEFAHDYHSKCTTWISAKALYLAFDTWRNIYRAKSKLDCADFSSMLSSLVENRAGFPLLRERRGGCYKYKTI